MDIAVGWPDKDNGKGEVIVYDYYMNSIKFQLKGQDFGNFGASLSMSGHGAGYLAVGSTQSDSPNVTKSGRVDVFKKNNGEWSLEKTIFGSEENEQTGSAIVLSDKSYNILIASPHAAIDSGLTKLYDITPDNLRSYDSLTYAQMGNSQGTLGYEFQSLMRAAVSRRIN